MTIVISEVELITSAPAKLRSSFQGGVDDKNRAGEAIGGLILTLGFSLVTVPSELLGRGPDVVLNPGTRFDAAIDGAHSLERAAVLEAQVSIPTPRADVARLFFYKRGTPMRYPIDIQIMCGAAFIGSVQPGQYFSVELPPGLYWIRGLYIGSTKAKPLAKENPNAFLQLRVEGGQKYFVELGTYNDKKKTWLPVLVDPATGSAEIDNMPLRGEPSAAFTLSYPPLRTHIPKSFNGDFRAYWLSLLQMQGAAKFEMK
jgi:hypothetical protein